MIILSTVPVEFNSRIVHSNGRELNIIRLLGEGGRETVRGGFNSCLRNTRVTPPQLKDGALNSYQNLKTGQKKGGPTLGPR